MLAHAAVGPGEAWRSWSFDPLVVLGLVVAAVAYGSGVRRLRRRRSAVRVAAFAGGLLAVAVALLSPLDRVSEALFSAHMLQHLVLMVVAAPLLVVGRPLTTGLVGLPRGARRAAARLRRSIAPVGRWLRRPAVAWVVLTVPLWAWHTPALYTAALERAPVHALEHATFLVPSMLVWSVALDGRRRSLLGALGRAAFLVATAVQGGVLGALLLFASSPLYPVHGAGPSRWGLTPLEDQQLAGGLMWIPPMAVYLVAAAALVLGAFRDVEARPTDGRAGAEAVT
jgi:cytochrome c oxidase assembly factor CtaG